MPSKYRIHPAIGIARLGDSPGEFYISPEKPASLPIACDAQGNALMSPDGKSEAPVTRFKDAEGRIKRQAARFQIYAYDEDHPEGRLLHLGDQIEGGGNAGTLVDIQWRVYLANKKSVWYTFSGLEGEHGYSGTHPLRNADIAGDDARQQLIIDPGPRFVDTTSRRRASFDRDGNGVYATRFPPKGMAPHDIDTLGEILTDDHGCLLVLGGHGKSGTFKTGVGQPVIENYANTDGWFDDISDGPVMARLVMFSPEVERQRFIDVEYPAWVVTGYPRYAPQILDLVTVEDVVYDLSIRKFAYRTDLYGIPGTWRKTAQIEAGDAGALMHWNAAPLDWNPDYKPWFYRDVWPILFRADEMSYLNNVLQQSNYPHNQSQRGNFDVTRCSVPPMLSPRALARLQNTAIARNRSGDLFLDAIQIKLQMFDDAVERALHGKLRTHASIDGGAPPESASLHAEHEAHGKSLFAQLRSARAAVRDAEHSSALDSVTDQYEAGLKSAAADFAQAVMPENRLDPGEYLNRWRTENKRDAPDYVAASQKLKKAVDEALEPFVKAIIAHWEGGLGKTGTLAAFLHSAGARGDAADADRSDKPSDVEEVIRGTIHNIAAGAMTRFRSGGLIETEFHKATVLATNDPFHDYRNYLYKILRRPGEENVFRTAGKPESRLFQLPLMPLLAGDGPNKNELPSKFLRLTDYQLYILRQWAEGKFFNEVDEGWVPDTAIDPFQPFDWENRTPRDLDRGVLSNLLGGAFFPGAEVCWTIRNPSIYKEPFRLKADPAFYTFGQTAANENQSANNRPISEQFYLGNGGNDLSQGSNFEVGLQPGDMTKYSALPWQADFNECTTQNIDITYEIWNVIDPSSENDPWLKQEQKIWETLWWPAHRPLQSFEVVAFDSEGKPVYQFLTWSRGVPQTHAGDLKMVTEWPRLGFLVRNPYLQPSDIDVASPDKKYIAVERSEE